MTAVSPRADGSAGAELELEELEVALLQSLARQLVDFVSPDVEETDDPLIAMVGIDPHATIPDDPALLRLLPDAYSDDEDAAAEFRRFTERDLREGKVRNAQAVLDVLQTAPRRVSIGPEEMGAWLGFLNDTRLTLGTRLGITEDNHAELDALPDDDPRASLVQVYDWLTFVQDALVQVVLGEA